MDSVTLSVEGRNVNALTKALRQTRGVAGVDVNLGDNVAVVTFDEAETTPQQLKAVVLGTHHRSNSN